MCLKKTKNKTETLSVNQFSFHQLNVYLNKQKKIFNPSKNGNSFNKNKFNLKF